jgi:hypothetical protein
MCFSSGASFAGGIIILAIGVVTATKVHKSSQLVFASIPLFFGIQQITEGFLWLAIPNPDLINLQKLCTYTFLIMAQVLWPTMIPLSVLAMEVDKKRKKILWVLLGVGLSVSLYYGICILLFKVSPQIVGFHIQYNNGFPNSLSNTAFIAYLLATIPPLFVSSIKRTHLMGILMFLSCAVTAFFFTQYLTSVWCFFAALISIVVFWILWDSKRKFKFDKLLALKNELIDPLINKISKS